MMGRLKAGLEPAAVVQAQQQQGALKPMKFKYRRSSAPGHKRTTFAEPSSSDDVENTIAMCRGKSGQDAFSAAADTAFVRHPDPSQRRITRVKAARPPMPESAGNLLQNGLCATKKRFTAPPDWFVPDCPKPGKTEPKQPSATESSASEPATPVTSRHAYADQGNSSAKVGDMRPKGGQQEDAEPEDPFDPANHPDDALKYRNLTEFITVINDKFKGCRTREVLKETDKVRRINMRDGDLLVDIRRDVKDVFRSKVLVSGEGGRNVNVETKMDPKFEKVLIQSNTKDVEAEKRQREKERCLWLQEDRMRWIRALYEHIKEFRTQAKFYLAMVIEARGRDPEYDPDEDEQVIAIRKQMIPWADEVMSNILLLAGIETQIYADLQKEMPSVKL